MQLGLGLLCSGSDVREWLRSSSSAVVLQNTSSIHVELVIDKYCVLWANSKIISNHSRLLTEVAIMCFT